MMAEHPKDPNALVTEFVKVFHNNDPDEILPYFAEDGVWHNMPMPPAVGRAAIGALLRKFVADGILLTGVDVHHQLAEGNVVINERTDHIDARGKTASIPVCGVFIVENGLIREWRDYCDGVALAALAP